MPSSLFLRCIQCQSERNSILSEKTTYTTAGPSQEEERALLSIQNLQGKSSNDMGQPKDTKDTMHKNENSNAEKMLELYPWYHGQIDRMSAEQKVLSKRENGTFLVRKSMTRKGQHVITFNANGRVKHIQFYVNNAGQCNIKHYSFETIFDMLEYFRVHEVPVESTRFSDLTLASFVSSIT